MWTMGRVFLVLVFCIATIEQSLCTGHEKPGSVDNVLKALKKVERLLFPMDGHDRSMTADPKTLSKVSDLLVPIADVSEDVASEVCRRLDKDAYQGNWTAQVITLKLWLLLRFDLADDKDFEDMNRRFPISSPGDREVDHDYPWVGKPKWHLDPFRWGMRSPGQLPSKTYKDFSGLKRRRF